MDVDDDKQPVPPNDAVARGGDARGARGGNRGDRLAAALRSNLARRKEQGRARAGHRTAAPSVTLSKIADVAAMTRLRPADQAEPAPHDSAEIVTENSANHTD